MRPSHESAPPAGFFPILVVVALALLLARPARSQSPAAAPTGRELAGVPALNFDADEGVGYGAILQLFDYGSVGARPYRYLLQPTLSLTTKGRRDATLFFDAPALLPRGWRLTAFAGQENQLAAPYYGIGNDSRRDLAIDSLPDTYFYRFERRQLRFTADAQHRIGTLPLRMLVGGGVSRVRVDALAFDADSSLVARELGEAPAPGGSVGWARAGLVLDTRDRESGPTRGRWVELLAQRASGAHDFSRVTGTWREYLPLAQRLTLAARVVAQQAAGDVPFHELSTIQGSLKPSEGVGGSGSVRGLPKNRYVGKGLAIYDAELRWRAAELSLRGKPAHLVLSSFADAGRVWSDRIRVSELAKDLHAGAGVGARLGLGPNFVIALDVGHSSETAAATYLGLGYAF